MHIVEKFGSYFLNIFVSIGDFILLAGKILYRLIELLIKTFFRKLSEIKKKGFKAFSSALFSYRYLKSHHRAKEIDLFVFEREVAPHPTKVSKKRNAKTGLRRVFVFIKIQIFHMIFGVWYLLKTIILLFIAVVSFPVRVLRALGERRRKRRARKMSAPFKPSLFYKFKFFFLGGFLSFVFIFLPIIFFVFVADLPNPDSLSVDAISKTTKIYDRNGILLYEIYANQNRTPVKLADIPKNLQNATVAIEDKDFYTHPGFDIRGIVRSALVDFKGTGFQGGSTITQQLIKSAFLTPEPTIIRKVKEIALAFWAERVYSKQHILELYFNYVPYGGTAWGVQSASEIYFGKAVSQLDLAQSAFLAGLPQAPSIYSPYSGQEGTWKVRQKEVLDAMVQQGYITKNQETQAVQEKLVFQPPDVPLKAPHFVMYVKDLLIKKYGLSEVERGGLQVKTSLDLSTQDMAQKVVTDQVAENQNLDISNGASLVVNPTNGDILAMVGSKDYFDSADDGNVNLTTALRQPGSTVKIITYSLALSSGFTEATMLQDEPLTINIKGEPPYKPVNYDGKFHGWVPLRIAFANSFNIPAVRTVEKVGVQNMVDFATKMGISDWNNPYGYGPSVTLGGADTTMVDLTTVYSTIANSGNRVDLDPLLEVDDSNGKVLYKKHPKSVPVVNPGVAFIISSILSDNSARQIEFGLNSPLVIDGHRVSVKTGTTDNKRDNWTVGYTPNYVVATWVGNNDNSPMSQSLASGITGAAPMWHEIMSNLLAGKSDAPLSIPDNIIAKQCLGTTMYFLRGTENKDRCYAPKPTPSSSPTPTP